MNKGKKSLRSILALLLSTANVAVATPVDRLSENDAEKIIKSIFTVQEIEDLCSYRGDQSTVEEKSRFDNVLEKGCQRITIAGIEMG